MAGTTGYDYSTMVMPSSVEEQARNTMVTIEKALAEAGFALSDVVRVHYYLTDAALVDAVFSVVGAFFAEIRPAATMVICDLVDPEIKVEIEVTALKG
ncbi:enamine deaminase RidA (YjgF/YER057c/UK114 family) [Kaistia dalseonensis]|uniref:Enamine deaminase RidA (YjgF/YER057c/UK114 family) n=1 Tax=Kaistia dalseonensis TaxID=410840 RepID=A0ABU0H3M0_9HYPH|nr:enamine deaminase RidA (YjgF/YER057c/UK114 family) [Kaistia dalseonensis]